MLTAPVERDIRIAHVMNRFYAAAAPRFFQDARYVFPDLSASPSTPTSTLSSAVPLPESSLLAEATHALHTVLLTRHLQRVLEALPSASPTPPTAPPLPAASQRKSLTLSLWVSPRG
ncbi:hypothetical protein C8R47DRAFT_1229862 [Mycena vitilis]|nr:hypothetical protein C8R47DRAFT_1229862 [Mycena vitilis]